MKSILIVGAGAGLSASLARVFAGEGYAVALAARNTGKLDELCTETGAAAFQCDAADPASVARLFEQAEAANITPDVVVYNPSARVRGPITEIDPGAVLDALRVTAFGAFLVGQHAARQMLARGSGAILFTGASAGVKGFPRSASFAMGKFALRGLAQSMARELHPQNVHVAHFVIDGAIRSDRLPEDYRSGDKALDPDSIARTYLATVNQDRSAWTDEIALRPWVETF